MTSQPSASGCAVSSRRPNDGRLRGPSGSRSFEDATHERIAIALTELIDELQSAGRDFAEGHAVLVEILGTAHG